jgi:hypothetical protein
MYMYVYLNNTRDSETKAYSRTKECAIYYKDGKQLNPPAPKENKGEAKKLISLGAGRQTTTAAPSSCKASRR